MKIKIPMQIDLIIFVFFIGCWCCWFAAFFFVPNFVYTFLSFLLWFFFFFHFVYSLLSFTLKLNWHFCVFGLVWFHFQIHWLAWLVSLNILLCRASIGAWAKNQLCEVETGQTNIILDIEESRANCKYLRKFFHSFCYIFCVLFCLVFAYNFLFV